MSFHTVQLIVGLGNPGPDYARTRHNAGADFVHLLAQHYNSPLQDTPKFFGLSAKTRIANHDVRLLIPTTFMNLSGKAVGAIANFFKIPTASILVAHDELDLAPGIARLKVGGGHGGHNGLRDIIAASANDKSFGRLRIGIGHPGSAKLVSNYVLKKAPPAEQAQIDTSLENALSEIGAVVSGEWERAMKSLHTKK